VGFACPGEGMTPCSISEGGPGSGAEPRDMPTVYREPETWHYQLGKSVALPGRHQPISSPAGSSKHCPGVAVGTRKCSSGRAGGGHGPLRSS
jgi:hypothetical protein